MKRPFLYVAVGWCLVVALVTGVGPAVADAAASSANVSKSYSSSVAIPAGSIVSLSQTNQNSVEPSNTTNAKRAIGVAVQESDSLIAVDSDSTTTQVATSGTVTTLVSNVNGTIKVGDSVAISPFDGIGMKSAIGERVIGLAQTAFDGTQNGTVTKQVTDKNGRTNSIRVGYVQLSIAVGLDDGVDSGTSTGLQRFVRSLTGHQVSTPRIIISLVIAVCTLVALIVLIYSAIYGSIVSIGRNPLAKNAIFRALWHVVWMATITVATALLLMYFLLR